MDTNRKPTIPDSDDSATFSRLHPIPFTVRIPKEQIDRELLAKLLLEGPGILAWAVAGAKLWHESGLQKPAEVETANQDWRAEMDQLVRFVEERCIEDDRLQTPAAGLYAEYKRWAEAAGEHPMPGRSFGMKIPDRGFTKERNKRGLMYKGIGLRATGSDE
jgi:putative DNA primase/helicase